MRTQRQGFVVLFGAAALLLGACMSASMGTGLTRLSADTYRISRVDGVGRYPDAATMKAAVVDEADAFARSQGKVAVPIASHEQTMRAGHLSTVEYEFRLAAPDVPAATPAASLVRGTAVAEPQTPATADFVQPAPAVAAVAPAAEAAGQAPTAVAVAAAPASAPEPKPDLYHELVMLDDLRKRGILTDAEFQALKTKLLAGK